MEIILTDNQPIDKLILKAIIVLNEKGYITKYSCQGHVEYINKCFYHKHGNRDKKHHKIYTVVDCSHRKFLYKQANAYVKFKDEETLQYIRKYKKVRLPYSYFYESRDVIRANFHGSTEEEIQRKIELSAKALERWAKRLPDFDSLKQYVDNN